MQVGIVGLPRSGKTTVFNAATRGRVEVASYRPGGQPNVGVAKVPDARLQRLAEVYQPKRVVQAEVTYIDTPGAPEGLGESQGIAGEYLGSLQTADMLLLVARSFEDASVTHIYDRIDAVRDVGAMLDELTFSDLGILERRVARIAEGSKGAKPQERETLDKEHALLDRLKSGLEEGTAVRSQHRSDDEQRAIEGFQLLTAKPLVLVANIGEEQLAEAADIEARLASTFGGPQVCTAALCGRLEMELAQMDADDEQEFRDSLGAGESGLDSMVRLTQEAADLLTFFTGNPNEVHAWTVGRGTTAIEAAGRIHSDFERGFIRAEVVAFDGLAESGSVAEARRRGLLRQEGKAYVVHDGDVVNVLFNV